MGEERSIRRIFDPEVNDSEARGHPRERSKRWVNQLLESGYIRVITTEKSMIRWMD